MYSIEKFAVLIIVYKPTKRDIFNIKKNISKFKKSIIVWNSERNYNFSRNHSIEIELKENLGQATALNIGIERALKMDIEIVLTLDQDSELFENSEKIIKIVNKYDDIYKNPAGFSFEYFTNSKKYLQNYKINLPSSLLTPITSGCIYLTKVWKELNGFNNYLFIEGIDTDFAIKAKLKNFNFYKFDYPIMLHDAGISISKNILNFNFTFRKHSDIRVYLQYRNNLNIFIKNILYFPKWAIRSIFNLFTKKAFVVILGSSNPLRTSLWIIKGIFHGLLESTIFKNKLKQPKFYFKNNS